MTAGERAALGEVEALADSLAHDLLLAALTLSALRAECQELRAADLLSSAVVGTDG